MNGLQQTVMDAGCVGDKRFLVGFCFKLNASYLLSDSVNSDLWPDMTILDVMDYGIRSDDSLLAKILTANSIAMYRPEMVFSSLIDYDTGRVTLSFGEAEEFFDRFQKIRRSNRIKLRSWFIKDQKRRMHCDDSSQIQ